MNRGEQSQQLKDIIKNRDLDGLKAISSEILNDHDHYLCEVVKVGWDEGIKEYQLRYEYWAWAIKNCFTVWRGSYDPYECFRYCPEKYRNRTIESVNSYGELASDKSMMAFPDHHQDMLDELYQSDNSSESPNLDNLDNSDNSNESGDSDNSD